MLRYAKLVVRPQQLFRFTGLTREQYVALVQRLAPLWEVAERQRLSWPHRKRAIGAGRKYRLSSLEDKLLLGLVFYRLYLTEDLMGWLFGLDRSNVNRLLHRLEPLLAEAADPALPRGLRDANRQRRRIGRWEDFTRTYPDLVEVIVDAMEQPRRRPPKRVQRRYYSGKRKRHTLKTQLVVSRRGRILDLSGPVPGRVHDYRLFQRTRVAERLPPETVGYLDRGYDGATTDYPTSAFLLPVKRRRNHRVLTRAERRYNRWHARVRVVIEHLIAKLKKYQLLAQIYRHRTVEYGQRVRNIAALVNFRQIPQLA